MKVNIDRPLARFTERGDWLLFSFGVLLFATVTLVLWERLTFGVDFTDESFPAAVALRLVRYGLRPFVDEVHFSGSGAVLIAPFLSLTGNLADGLILYLRKVYFAFLLVESLVVYLCIRRIVPTGFALVVCAIPLSFIPHNIPGPSYNTMGAGLLLLAAMLAWRAGLARTTTERAVAASSGVLYSLSGIAHPAFALAGIFSCVLNLAVARNGGRYFGLLQSAGFFAGAVLAYLLLQTPAVSEIRDSMRYMNSIGSASDIVHKVQTALSSMLMPAFSFMAGDTRSSLAVWNAMFLVVIPLFFLVRGIPQPEKWLVESRVIIPSCIAGLVLAVVSTNNTLMASIGTLPAIIVSAVYLRRWAAARESRVWPLAMTFVVASAVIASMCYSLSPYRDGPLSALTHRVESGPFRGLLTTSVKFEFVKRFESDLRQLTEQFPALKHGLFLDRFPAGYLLAPYQPCTDTLWHFQLNRFPNLDRKRTLRAFESQGCEPDVVFIMHRIPYSVGTFDKPKYPEADELHAFITVGGRYQSWKQSTDYSIYLRLPEATAR